MSLHPVCGYKVKRPVAERKRTASEDLAIQRSERGWGTENFWRPTRPQTSLPPSIAAQDENILAIDDYNFPQRERRADRKSALLFWSRD
jgi:hypothetical protein